MIRRVISIDEGKCNGCGRCVGACHEGAIGLVGGKARLMCDDYCDGLGDCLPECPMNAISFVEREAAPYDEAAVKAAQASKNVEERAVRNWPVQLRLAPVRAEYYDGADILVSADCAAYAYEGFHADFMRGRVTLIGCPKLDAVNYAEKLGEIFAANDVRSVTLVRMQVPCCGGLERAVMLAAAASGKKLPLRVVTLSSEGKIVSAGK